MVDYVVAEQNVKVWMMLNEHNELCKTYVDFNDLTSKRTINTFKELAQTGSLYPTSIIKG